MAAGARVRLAGYAQIGGVASPCSPPQAGSPQSIASARSIRQRAGTAGALRFCLGCINPCSHPRPSRPQSAYSIVTALRSWSPPAKACCGSLLHHLGREDEALSQARNNIDAWTREIEGAGLDAILVIVSGCGTTIKDYGFMLRNDPAYADKAARDFGSRARHQRISGYAQIARMRALRCRSPLPIMRPARCSTAKRSARAEGLADQGRF